MKAPDFHKTVRAICSAMSLGLLAISLAAPQGVWADDDHGRGRGNEKNDDESTAPGQLNKLNPIGAWFGIARPCPPPPGDTSPLHASFCQTVCGACPNSGALPPEVPMMPTLLGDGTVLADDAGEIGLYHTTAHGKWEVSANDGLPDRPGTTRYKATFFWLGQNPPLLNSVRPRFVTYFDPTNPDVMIGYIQPHFFPIGIPALPIPPNPPYGIVNVLPATDPFLSNHIPAIDPIGPALPPGCTVPPGGNCLGTYHFIIRRIKAQ